MRQIAARKATRKAIYKPLVDLPPLSPEDYAGLRASISVSGVVVPIIVWPHRGVHYVVDGSYRRTIARGLGYECPEIVRSDLTEEEARIMARALNLARRQLRTGNVRSLQINSRKHPTGLLGGLLRCSVSAIRRLSASVPNFSQVRKFPHLDKIVGEDGKSYPSSFLTSAQRLPMNCHGSVNHERYTPSWMVEAVRRVLAKSTLIQPPASRPTKLSRPTSSSQNRWTG